MSCLVFIIIYNTPKLAFNKNFNHFPTQRSDLKLLCIWHKFHIFFLNRENGQTFRKHRQWYELKTTSLGENLHPINFL